MLKKYSLLLMTLGLTPLLATTPAHDYKVSADFLYLMPTMGDSYFVVASDTAGSALPGENLGTRKNNNFGFSPGFRAGLGYGLSGSREVNVKYTWLYASQNKTVTAPFLKATSPSSSLNTNINLIPPSEFQGSASSSLGTLYQSLEASFLQESFNFCNLQVALQAGLEGTWLNMKENLDYISTGPDVGDYTARTQCHTWGFGPQVGAALNYTLARFGCSCPSTFSFFGGASGGLLTGQTNSSVYAYMNNVTLATTAPLLDVDTEPTWSVIPALHARLGFDYSCNLSGWNTSFKIGYEFSNYIGAITRLQTYSDDRSLGNRYENYSVQGLVVSAAVSF